MVILRTFFGAVTIGFLVWKCYGLIKNASDYGVVYFWTGIGLAVSIAVLFLLFAAVIRHAERQAYRRFPGVSMAACGFFHDEFGQSGGPIRLLVITDRWVTAFGGLGSFRQVVWQVPAEEIQQVHLDYWGEQAASAIYPAVRIDTTRERDRFFLGARIVRPRTARRDAAALSLAIRRSANKATRNTSG